MVRITMPSEKPKAFYSKVSTKSQTVLPQEVRERLRVRPGDRLRYVIDESGVRIDRDSSISGQEEDPFIAFTEWASDLDDKAYADL